MKMTKRGEAAVAQIDVATEILREEFGHTYGGEQRFFADDGPPEEWLPEERRAWDLAHAVQDRLKAEMVRVLITGGKKE